MNILFKKNNNPIYQDSLNAAIAELAKNHNVSMYDDSRPFFDIFNLTKPTIVAIDSSNISSAERKCLTTNKVKVIDWNELSKSKLYIDINLFQACPPTPIFQTGLLGYIKYDIREKDALGHLLDIKNIEPTKVFSNFKFVSHVYCGYLPYNMLNAAINSCQTLLVTNPMLYNIGLYLNKKMIVFGKVTHDNIDGLLPENALKDIENAPEYQFTAS